MKILIDIFFTFLKIGAFSFGGGYAMIPFIEKETVHINGWLTSMEFVDIIAISQMTPGPIAVNSSTFAGYKIAKLYGSIAGTTGVVLISFILMTILSKSLSTVKDSPVVKNVFKGIRPAVLGLILSAALSVGKTAIIDIKSFLISIFVFTAIMKFKIHPILTIVISGMIGYIVY